METKQIIEKTEALIDALRATCSLYGLSGDSIFINHKTFLKEEKTMKRLKYIIVAIVLLSSSPLYSLADYKSLDVNVGDQETVDITGFHEGDGIGEWSVSDRSAVKIVSETDYRVTFKVLKWVQHEVLIRYEWRYGSPSRLKTYEIFVRILKPNITLSASPSGGKINEGERVYLTCNKSDADIFYTLDGYDPTINALTYYSTGIIIEKSCTLKAYASWGGVNSDVIEEKYTIDSAPAELSLTANPPGGLVYKDTRVYLNTNESGTDIYYTLDGFTPSKYSTPYNSSGIAIDKDCTLKAIAYKDNRESKVLSETYTLYTEPTRISVSISKSSINVGETTTATYTLFPWNAASSVSWSSDNTAIAEVSSSGNVVGISAGTTIIRATTANGLSESCRVTVSGDGYLFVSKTRFPDDKFREYLINNNILTEEDIKNVTELYLSYISPLNLKGIEYFTNLKKLSCYACDASNTEFDFSNNTSLEILGLSCCRLSSLDVSKCKSLKELNCTLNRIKGEEMDALINSLPYNTSENNILRVIDYEINGINNEGNEFTAAHAYAAKAKGWIPYYCDVRGHWLEYEDKPITIDATFFPDENFRKYLLEQDYGKDGVITVDELEGITRIDVHGSEDFPGNIVSLQGIELLTALTELSCTYNQLTYLDVSKNKALTTLECDNNKLTALDITKNKALSFLSCGYNQLSLLDVSQNSELTDFNCFGNFLTSLDVSHNTKLKYLSCYSNQLTSLDVSKNKELCQLYCRYNLLTSLDVSKNTALNELSCNDNHLTSLDVSNTALKRIFCYRNNIKGDAMDDLINSLPLNTENDSKLYVKYYGEEDNVCTTTQVAAAKAKGWTPYYYNSGWVEYEGSEPATNIKITVIIKNNMEEDALLTKAMLILQSGVALVWWFNDDKSTLILQSGYVLSQTLRNVDYKDEGQYLAASNYYEKLGYNSNIVLYDENGNHTTYLAEMEDKPVKIVDGGIYHANIISNTTSINSSWYIDENRKKPIYNLNGQRLDKPCKGINIIGGKKVFVK